jgi:SAM-dependent methyltransferase
MTEPPTVPAAGLFYGGDLAYVHDAAFGHLARGGARMLLRLLGRTGIRTGLVIDLGAGSGITARALTDAGYEVLGVELSPDMVEFARRRTPAARFVRSSLLDADLPACAAVTAIGARLNYAADPRAGRRQLGPLFARIHQALEPGGLFLLDLLASTGFHTRLLAGYGRAARFRRGHAGILAIKPSDERSLKVRRGPRRRYCLRVCQNRSSVAAFRARRAS